jgi:hypothetical protein
MGCLRRSIMSWRHSDLQTRSSQAKSYRNDTASSFSRRLRKTFVCLWTTFGLSGDANGCLSPPASIRRLVFHLAHTWRGVPRGLRRIDYAGMTGNPGGRPRSIATVILERRPTASEDLVALWTLVAFGSASAIRRQYGVTPRLKDRLAAAAAVADRLHGRAVPAQGADERADVFETFIMPEGTHVRIM